MVCFAILRTIVLELRMVIAKNARIMSTFVVRAARISQAKDSMPASRRAVFSAKFKVLS